MPLQPWQMTIPLSCTDGHLIQATWRIPQAQVHVQRQDDGVAIAIDALQCQITYEGAFLEDGCLKCVRCGAEVPAPVVESLLKAQCPGQEQQEDGEQETT